MNKKLRLKEKNFNEIIEVFRHASSIASVAINEIYNTKFITELNSALRARPVLTIIPS